MTVAFFYYGIFKNYKSINLNQKKTDI